MADPSTYRPKPGQIPDSPGVYRFRDAHRRVIYVGKAKSLRQRLANYFQDLAVLHPRTRSASSARRAGKIGDGAGCDRCRHHVNEEDLARRANATAHGPAGRVLLSA
jgi:GIY-YIG catalytic domain-containing protein